MFHDENPIQGHFEPLINKKKCLPENQIDESNKSKTISELDNSSLQDKLANATTHLCKNALLISDCGDSLFNTVASLTNNDFDSESLRCYMAQSFSNAILYGDKIEIACIETCIKSDMIITCGVASWETFIAKVGEPYERSGIKGADFCFEWLSYILKVKIKTWSTTTNIILRNIVNVQDQSKYTISSVIELMICICTTYQLM